MDKKQEKKGNQEKNWKTVLKSTLTMESMNRKCKNASNTKANLANWASEQISNSTNKGISKFLSS